MKFRVENAKGETAKADVGRKRLIKRKRDGRSNERVSFCPFLHGHNELRFIFFGQ